VQKFEPSRPRRGGTSQYIELLEIEKLSLLRGSWYFSLELALDNQHLSSTSDVATISVTPGHAMKLLL